MKLVSGCVPHHVLLNLGKVHHLLLAGGGVATLLAALLHDGPPEGLGPVRCVALGPAAVLSAELAEAAAPFTTSVILGCGGTRSMPVTL